jgi:hypothetical protein
MRPLPVDGQRGDTVRRCLDGDRRHDERGDPPLAEHDRHERRQGDKGRNGVDVTDPREPERDIGAQARAVIREPHVHVLVPASEAVLGERIVLERPARGDGDGGEHGEAHKGDDEIGAHRMAGHRASEPSRKAARLERRAPVATASIDAGGLVRTGCLLVDGHASGFSRIGSGANCCMCRSSL